MKEVNAFLKNIWGGLSGFALSSILLLTMFPVTIGTTGCTTTPAQIIADAKVVTAAAQSIGMGLAVTDPQLSAQILSAVSVANTALNGWKGGNVQQDIISALVTLQTVLSAIPAPQAQLVAEFIPIAIAGLDAIFAALPATASVTVKASVGPWGGYKVSHRFGRSIEGDFKASWNAAAKRHPIVSLL